MHESKIYNIKFKKPFKENSINVDHKNKIIFVHNPKTAGTSIKRALQLSIDNADHRIPTYLIHPKTWEEYFSFVVVRHPIERLISSFRYHSNPEYKGSYYRRYPCIHQLTFEQYFNLMVKEPYAIRPQIDYIQHSFSDKQIDMVCRFENLANDLNLVFNILGIKTKLPHLNISPGRKRDDYFKTEEFFKAVIKYYHDDFVTFGYSTSSAYER